MAVSVTEFEWALKEPVAPAWLAYNMFNEGYTLNGIGEKLGISPQLASYYIKDYPELRERVLNDARVLSKIELQKERILNVFRPDKKPRASRLRRNQK